MSTMDASVLALVGVLLGGLLSLLGQRLNVDRQNSLARAEALRMARLGAYSDFAKVVMEYRREVMARRVRQLRDGSASDDAETLSAIRKSRSAAWHGYYRTQLLCSDLELEARAKAVLESVKQLRDADTLDSLDVKGDGVRAEVDEFIRLAGRQVA